MQGNPNRSALGGAANEAGSGYRAGVGAVIAAYSLYGWDLLALELPRGSAVPDAIRFEADAALDDIVAELKGGGRALLQAKRSLKLSDRAGSALAQAVQQCRRAVAEEDLDPIRDRLVLTGGSISGPIRDLQLALRRRREPLAGAPTAKEADAMKRFEALLVGMAQVEHDLLLDCLVIWECDAEEPGGDAAERAAALLDGSIVAYGQGHRALAALGSTARDLARRRGGTDLSGLIEILREAEVELLDDASGAAAARLVTRQQAGARYRRHLQARGETIRLLGVGAGLPDLPLADVDADVKATEPGLDQEHEKSSERELELLLRRRGRLLLTGLPGAGKSTSVRIAAARQAGNPDAPLPVFISLDALANRLGSKGFGELLLDLATEHAPAADRALLREEIEAAIGAGNATLYLDALDETRARSRALVDALCDYLDGVKSSVELILTTRDSKIADAQILKLPEARLAPPSGIRNTIKAILRAFAQRRGVEDPETWIKPRLGWVDRALSRDRDLESTPLMPVLLTVSAGTKSDPGQLPQLRADILKGVVADVVAEWETTKAESGSLALGEISGSRAADALLECFVIEGALLAKEGRPDLDSVVQDLAGVFTEDWKLGAGDARASAREAIAFWDEAGVFLLTEDDELVPRVKLFSELADAWHHSQADPDRVSRWVREALEDGERGEALKLAASLSAVAADALAAAGAAVTDAGSKVLFLALDAIEEGAEVSASRIAELFEALLEVMAAGGGSSLEAAGRLAGPGVPAALQQRAFESFERDLPADHALIAQVRATVNWDLERDPAALRRFEMVLDSKPPEPIEERADAPAVLALWGVDSRWSDAVAVAAEELVPSSEAAARVAAEQTVHVAGGAAKRIVAVLEQNGYGELAIEHQRLTDRTISRSRSWAKRWQESRQADLDFFELVGELGDEVGMGVRERRGLGELVDLFFTLEIPSSQGHEFTKMVLEFSERMRELIEIIISLAGFDPALLATQARQFRREIEGEDAFSPSSLIFIPGTERKVDRWGCLEDPEAAVAQLLMQFHGFRFSASVAASALVAAPPELEVHPKVLEKLDELERWRQRLAGLVALDTAGSLEGGLALAREWLSSGPSPLRRSAAVYVGVMVSRSDPARALLLDALADPDGKVRQSAIESLRAEDLDPELRAAVAASTSGLGEWDCTECGESNPPGTSPCRKCSTVGPELSKPIEQLLAPVSEGPSS
jgi:hypothetical protein